MRNVIFIIGLITIFLSCNQSTKESKLTSQDSTVKSANNDTVPAHSQDSLLAVYTIPAELKNAGQINPGDNISILTNFYPIGWSRNGAFAYMTKQDGEAADAFFFKFFIQDMATDKIIAKYEQTGNEGEAFDVKKIWEKNKDKFTSQLKAAGIIQQSNILIDHLPLKVADKTYSFPVKNEMLFSKDYELKMIASTTISMLSNDTGTKVLYKKRNDQYAGILSNKITGYIKSPFENRIALFFLQERRGYEGPPNVIELSLIGTSY